MDTGLTNGDGAVVVGLGAPGLGIATGLARNGALVTAYDPKLVGERTLERCYDQRWVDWPKAAAAAKTCSEIGRGACDGIIGRLEDEVQGANLRSGVNVVFAAADRPSALRRATEILARVCLAPTKLITANVGPGMAQIRSYRFPLGPSDPCPFCDAPEGYVTSSYLDQSYTCEAPGGDLYTIPFTSAEANVASGLALSAVDWPAGTDVTVCLAPPIMTTTTLTKAPDCPLQCGRLTPWPPASLEVAHDMQLREIAAQAFKDDAEASFEFLRPIGRGVACGCEALRQLVMLREKCADCGAPIVPLEGAAFEIALADVLAYDPYASPASVGLPAPELLLVNAPGCASVCVQTTPCRT